MYIFYQTIQEIAKFAKLRVENLKSAIFYHKIYKIAKYGKTSKVNTCKLVKNMHKIIYIIT